jgi:hypothetical protein
MKCLQNTSKKQGSQRYATREDFCRVFKDDLDALYLLSFLIIGDHEGAERCLVSSLEDCAKTNHVFRQWAHLWAKRTIIRCAIRILQAEPGHSNSRLPAKRNPPRLLGGHFHLERILALGNFERCVVVMSVLERLSEVECALIFRRSLKEIRSIRIAALEKLADQGWPTSLAEVLRGCDRPTDSLNPSAWTMLEPVNRSSVSPGNISP